MMIKIIITIIALFCLVFIYACMKTASKADEAIEKMEKKYYD